MRLLALILVLGVVFALSTQVAEVRSVDVLRFTAYVGAVLTLPGTLIWRAANGEPRPLWEDLVLGTTVGLAAELPVYLVGRALDATWIVLAWPAVVVAISLAAHCRLQPEEDCDRRHFWISGYAERRVLVEGWGYIPAEVVGVEDSPAFQESRPPFWDNPLLLENDAAFSSPSDETVGRLRDEYGVRWLFVDRRYPTALRALEEVAELRYQNGPFFVFEIG